MSEIFNNIKQLHAQEDNMLVVFDVDDVITTPKDIILQSQNRKSSAPLIQAIVDRRAEEIENPNREALFWDVITEIITQAERVLVEETILDLKQYLDESNIPSIALTNCRTGKIGVIEALEEWRLEELNGVGIDFSSSFDLSEKIELDDPIAPLRGFPMYYSGIICTADYPKGVILAKFLEFIDYHPKRIVFIDDKEKNLLSVKKYCESKGIEFYGFLYTAAEKQCLEPLNQERAVFQFKYLESEGIWLGDVEADIKIAL